MEARARRSPLGRRRIAIFAAVFSIGVAAAVVASLELGRLAPTSAIVLESVFVEPRDCGSPIPGLAVTYSLRNLGTASGSVSVRIVYDHNQQVEEGPFLLAAGATHTETMSSQIQSCAELHAVSIEVLR